MASSERTVRKRFIGRINVIDKKSETKIVDGIIKLEDKYLTFTKEEFESFITLIEKSLNYQRRKQHERTKT